MRRREIGRAETDLRINSNGKSSQRGGEEAKFLSEGLVDLNGFSRDQCDRIGFAEFWVATVTDKAKPGM